MRLWPVFLALCVSFGPSAADAQAGAPAPRTPGGRIHGIVYDSLARAPLGGAWVQLAVADGRPDSSRTLVSDSLGRFSFEDVADGQYVLGFFHALADSLGIEPRGRTVFVAGHRTVRADLAVPSAGTLRALICGERVGKDSGVVVRGATVAGVIRGARSRTPAAGVSVSAEWLEMSLGGRGFDRRRPRLVTTTGENGYYAFCNAPLGGTIYLMASQGADTTDLIEAQVPMDGFLRRDLYLGPARVVVTHDTAARSDSAKSLTRIMRFGDGRLTGTVTSAESNRPIPTAQVRIVDGPASRVDDHGGWTIGNAPSGTRVLEIRAVGYYPERRAVDVITGVSPLHVALNTFKAVLDTVRIIARIEPDRQFSGFDERKKSGMGHYYTSADFAKRGMIETSDLFRNVPGVSLENTADGRLLLMRTFATIANRSGQCQPSVYLDGMQLFEASPDEIDFYAPLKRVRAIEIYNESFVPPQFARGLTGCGAIVIWSK
jgi:hypothetical protein